MARLAMSCGTHEHDRNACLFGVPLRIAGLFDDEHIDSQRFPGVAGNAPTTP